MSYKRPRARNRLVIVVILVSCLASLYVLGLKIHRMVHLARLERDSEHVAFLADAIYFNSSLVRKSKLPQVNFIISSQVGELPTTMNCQSNNGSSFAMSNLTISRFGSMLLMGTCSVVEDPIYVSLQLDDFNVQVDEPDPPLPTEAAHVVCVAHLVLYEDGATLLSLLRHFEPTASIVFVYAASLSDDLFHQLQKSRKIRVVPWKLPITGKSGEYSQLHLIPEAVQAAVEASLTDCFMRAAPSSRTVTLVDVGSLSFESAPPRSVFELSPAIVDLVGPNWRIEELLTYRVSINSDAELMLNERCLARSARNSTTSSSDLFSGCGDLGGRNRKFTQNGKKVFLRKTVDFESKGTYSDALSRCTSYKTPIEEVRQLMKLEFELKQRPHVEPCELQLLRDGFRCRVAVEYSKKMFRDRLKISVTNRRSLLHFRDGCHL